MVGLKKRWGVESNFQIAIIFLVFAITGSAATKLASPVTAFFGIYRDTADAWFYWTVRVLLIFPIYQILLVAFGWLFGQFTFFWNFEKKMLNRMGLGFLFK
jgi:hypothetical protein